MTVTGSLVKLQQMKGCWLVLNFATWTMWVAYRGRESLAAFSNPQDQTMMVIICRDMQGIWGLASWSCETVFSAASSAFAFYFAENLGTSCSPLTLGTFGEFPGYCRVSNSTFAQNHGGWLFRPTVPCQRKWRFPEMEVSQIIFL